MPEENIIAALGRQKSRGIGARRQIKKLPSQGEMPELCSPFSRGIGRVATPTPLFLCVRYFILQTSVDHHQGPALLHFLAKTCCEVASSIPVRHHLLRLPPSIFSSLPPLMFRLVDNMSERFSRSRPFWWRWIGLLERMRCAIHLPVWDEADGGEA